MSDLDLAKFITGGTNFYTPEMSGSRTEQASMRHGFAISDVDEYGCVQVILDGDYQLIGTDDDPDYANAQIDPLSFGEIDVETGLYSNAINVRTDELIYEGDRVSIVSNAGDLKAARISPDSTGATYAIEVAESVSAHFWVQEEATPDVPAGAYITIVPKDDDDPSAALGGSYTHIDTNSFDIYNSGSVLASFDADSVELLGGDVKLQANSQSQYELVGLHGGIIASTGIVDEMHEGDSGIKYYDNYTWNSQGEITSGSSHITLNSDRTDVNGMWRWGYPVSAPLIISADLNSRSAGSDYSAWTKPSGTRWYAHLWADGRLEYDIYYRRTGVNITQSWGAAYYATNYTAGDWTYPASFNAVPVSVVNATDNAGIFSSQMSGSATKCPKVWFSSFTNASNRTCEMHMHVSGYATNTLSAFHAFGGDTSVEPSSYETYSGAYQVTPLAYESQILATGNKVMSGNVEVYEVPLSDVDNQAGGRTATIATPETTGGL